jgi:hypothetical protein
MDIAIWLRGLGLERYELAFRNNEIDRETLPKLTAEDLKDLGVVLGGHRRKLLAAIAALQGGAAPSMPWTQHLPIRHRRGEALDFDRPEIAVFEVASRAGSRRCAALH